MFVVAACCWTLVQWSRQIRGLVIFRGLDQSKLCVVTRWRWDVMVLNLNWCKYWKFTMCLAVYTVCTVSVSLLDIQPETLNHTLFCCVLLLVYSIPWCIHQGSYLFVCLSVGEQDYLKTSEWILVQKQWDFVCDRHHQVC